MAAEKPSILEELVGALGDRGAPARELALYREHWAALPDSAHLPCPFCFVNSRKGHLRPTPEGTTEWRCNICEERFVRRQTG
jgi:hypothetical protein